MADISQFKSKLRQGGARSNQFEVSLQFPAVIGAGSASETASFLVNATSLPAVTVENIVVPYRGRPVNFAGERSFTPWSVTVINDGDFLIRNAFERWHDLIASYDTTNGALDPNLYQLPMVVRQLDRNGKKLKSYKFFDAYPVELGAMALSYENPSIQTFEVTFQYNYYVPDADVGIL
jgi:hypothetical protein